MYLLWTDVLAVTLALVAAVSLMIFSVRQNAKLEREIVLLREMLVAERKK